MSQVFYNSIKATSTPVLDGWGWEDYWDAEDWMHWHQLMVTALGINEANRILIHWYHQATQFADNYNWRSLNPTFRQYAKESGFFEGLFVGLSGLIVQPIGWGTDVVDSAGDVFGSVTSILKYAVPAVLVLLIVFVVLGLNRKLA